jgi:DNA repair protein RadC
MPKKNDFKLDVVSVRLVKDAPIYSEHTFNNPADIAAVMGDCMCQFDREVVCVVNLRSDLKPINVHFASVGSLNEAMAHPRELFKSSILSNAASMMLIHCHPSGNVFPSKADTMMTDRMNKLCELMGIPLIDHIIVGGDNREFFSFREKGMIDNPKITLSTDYRTLDIKSPLVAEQGKAMWVWNDYLLPSLVLNINQYKTIPIAIQYLKQSHGMIDWGAMMAMLVLAILPIVIFYIVCQKYIIEGVLAGAVKG